MCQGKISEYFDLSWVLSFQRTKKKYLCNDCQSNFTKLSDAPTCLGCGRKMNVEEICNDCIKWKKAYGQLLENVALYEYNGVMKEYFERFKFMGDFYFANVFNDELKAFVKKEYSKGKDWLYVPIPLSAQSYQTRMFNQVEGLFSGLEFAKLLAVKNKEKKQQSKLNRQERMKRSQPFILNKGSEEIIEGRKILLLDDIYTTGRTLYYAAEIIRSAGAKEIKSMTLAR
ncbi:ComF family protein [Liquorilactobacillus hordei]|uniref:ComF family protein n=1 Tax=Liquorilactobacillus hordei TaxID=468911 RepID=UPI0039ECDE0F